MCVVEAIRYPACGNTRTRRDPLPVTDNPACGVPYATSQRNIELGLLERQQKRLARAVRMAATEAPNSGGRQPSWEPNPFPSPNRTPTAPPPPVPVCFPVPPLCIFI